MSLLIDKNDEQANTQKIKQLIRRVYLYAIFNFFLVALVGVLLRTIQFSGIGSVYYKNILQAHSHMALGGWIMPALLALVLKFYPEIGCRVAYRHWRNIAVLIFVSAYGMLFSFPFQGYGSVSIVFSTLSILASYYLAFIVWKIRSETGKTVSGKFLIAGLFYLVLSSIGPFATVPLIIMGKAGSIIYFDAIYFYLHFQYNGWFSFLLLGILYKIFSASKNSNANIVFTLLNIACIPAFFLSTLWGKPPVIFYFISAVAAFLQLAALFFLLKDFVRAKGNGIQFHVLLHIALLIFSVKLILQFAGAFPAIADMSYQHRNFIIAYLHFVLIGFVSLFIFGSMATIFTSTWKYRFAMGLFLFAFMLTEGILFVQALSEKFVLRFADFNKWILAASCLFPMALFMIWYETLQTKNEIKAEL